MTTSETKKARILHRTSDGLQPGVKPIVLEYKKDKKSEGKASKGKPKYSKNLEDIQTLEGDILRVSQKAAKAFSKGIDTYQNEREKSAEEKTDGAIEDFVHNSAKAMSASMKEASDIPVDIADSITTNTAPYRKRLRKSLKDASQMIGFWRI
jgi:hypothetical protein